jgi:hypothetical protein
MRHCAPSVLILKSARAIRRERVSKYEGGHCGSAATSSFETRVR